MERSQSEPILSEQQRLDQLPKKLRREFSNLTLEEAEDLKEKMDDLFESFYKLYLKQVKPTVVVDNTYQFHVFKSPDTFKPPPKLTLKNAYKILKYAWKFGETPRQQYKRMQREQTKRENEMDARRIANLTSTTSARPVSKRQTLMYGSGLTKSKKRSPKRSATKRSPKRSAKKRSVKRSAKKRSPKRSAKKRSPKRSTKKSSKKRSVKKRSSK